MRYTGFHRAVQILCEDVKERWPIGLASEVNVEALVGLRHAVKEAGLAPPTYTACVTRAVAMAIAAVEPKYPQVNAMLGRWGWWRRLHHFPGISAGVAVAREENGEDAVFVQVIRRPQNMSLADLTVILKHASNAPAGELPDYQGCHNLYRMPRPLQRLMLYLGANIPRLHQRYRGTFSLTTVGKFGIDMQNVLPLTTPIQFGFGQIRKRPIVDGDRVTAAQTMWLSMAFDRRLLNGRPACQVLTTACHTLQTADEGRWLSEYGLTVNPAPATQPPGHQPPGRQTPGRQTPAHQPTLANLDKQITELTGIIEQAWNEGQSLESVPEVAK